MLEHQKVAEANFGNTNSRGLLGVRITNQNTTKNNVKLNEDKVAQQLAELIHNLWQQQIKSNIAEQLTKE